MIPSTRAMIKSKKENRAIDIEKAKFLTILSSTLNDSFGKSNGFRKATVLAGPDVYSAYRLVGLSENGNEKKDLTNFINYIKQQHPDRVISIDDSPKVLGRTPWATAYVDENHTAPDAIALPQDYYGFVIQPGDSVKKWNTPLIDKGYLTKLVDEDTTIPYNWNDFSGAARAMGMIHDRRSESGKRIGYVARPGLHSEHQRYHADSYPENISNANIVFTSGKQNGINGPDSELKAIALLGKQLFDADDSSNSDTRAAANMYWNYLKFLDSTWYNPRSYHARGTNEIALRSPEQVIYPLHGMPGSSFWEESAHAIDNMIGANMPATTRFDHLTTEMPILYGALQDDFQNRFQGDPGKIIDHAENIISNWDNPNGGRYADDHEYLELMNHMYNIGTNGQNAPGTLGKLHNHPVDTTHDIKHRNYWWKEGEGTNVFPMEVFNSLTNGRMTGSPGVKKIEQNLPNATKAARELYGVANDMYKDKKDKENFEL